MTEGIIKIKKGREKPIINQHPWIFSGAIHGADNATDGKLVTVVDHKDNFLARDGAAGALLNRALRVRLHHGKIVG